MLPRHAAPLARLSRRTALRSLLLGAGLAAGAGILTGRAAQAHHRAGLRRLDPAETDRAAPTGRAPVLFGAWQDGLPWDFDRLTAFEREVGRTAAIAHWYQAWEAGDAHELRHEWLATAAERGSVPMISWGSFDWNGDEDQPEYALRRIALGRWDDHVRAWADGLAAHGRPVLLRWGWEMNLGWAPWGRRVNGNHDQQYVEAWRRMHRIFQEAGATNVRWVWSPNALLPSDPEGTAFEPLFPGDDVVDWIGLDAYNHEPWYGWRSFDQIVDESYRRITALSQRPLMLAELGCSERRGHPDAKAAWIADALGRGVFEWPRIRAVVWFNEDKEGEGDWRVDSSSAASRAFRAAVSGPGYLGRWQEPA